MRFCQRGRFAATGNCRTPEQEAPRAAEGTMAARAPRVRQIGEVALIREGHAR